MKFKDIKEGDEVMVQEVVRDGHWGGKRGFWVCKKVDRVTPKQFMVGKDRYRKKDGRAVGVGYFEECKLAGEVADETQKMIVFKHENVVAGKIQIIGAKLTRFKPGYPNIIEIYEILKQVETLLDNDNEGAASS